MPAKSSSKSSSTPASNRILRNVLRGFLELAVVLLSFAAGASTYYIWPQRLDMNGRGAPGLQREGHNWVAPTLAGALYVPAGDFDSELAAYLQYDYLRGRPETRDHSVFLTVRETANAPRYEIRVELENDLLRAIPLIARLNARHLVPGTEFKYSTRAELARDRRQTEIFETAYSGPVRRKLEEFTAGELLSPVATFLVFKSRTDRRIHHVDMAALSGEEADQLAADIITVADFYSLPLELLLGVGAMENNYLNVDGDLDHRVWKRRPEKDDIVLRRTRRRVLVLNYSIGRWQITRDTLRHAHKLFLHDTRDYSQLPERLRPARQLDFATLDSHVMTTYAGLLLRDLLDRFPGEMADAIGAYNGGIKNPNPEYAAGVAQVAGYARSVLEHSVSMGSLPPSPRNRPEALIPAVETLAPRVTP
ncbi:MAG TPA: hypothetical protein VLT16_09590 [Candidatus Limnocylindrales bacterium]|nr:hypothetical protein [Candidatus Limnocylindrales bacterium]